MKLKTTPTTSVKLRLGHFYPLQMKSNKHFSLHSVFQPFSSRGTSQKFIIIWRNLNTPYSAIYSITREPSKELAEPLGSAEARLKNTALHSHRRGLIRMSF